MDRRTDSGSSSGGRYSVWRYCTSGLLVSYPQDRSMRVSCLVLLRKFRHTVTYRPPEPNSNSYTQGRLRKSFFFDLPRTVLGRFSDLKQRKSGSNTHYFRSRVEKTHTLLPYLGQSSVLCLITGLILSESRKQMENPGQKSVYFTVPTCS